MNIQVRVMSRQAQAEIKRLQVQIALLEGELRKTRGASAAMKGGMVDMMSAGNKAGSQLQWIGRQLMYNFTLPLAVAGGAAIKWQLNNEKAMTRVKKVYGDGSAAFNQLTKTEIPALGKAFEALSNRFGIAQADAINIAADWAAAGASGIALAKSVKLTMETMILGELDAVTATQALIAIQAQYGQSIDDLSKTIDILNMVENQTGLSMAGLIDGMSRAAGVARSSGVDVRHLAAMMAAISPAAGSAANGGNALKTMISRLLSPTEDAKQVLGLMGVNIADMGWKSLNASQRLELLAKKFKGLDKAQQAVVSATIASRYQINKFDVLMRDIINTNGYYQKSLKSTVSQVGNFNQRQRELNAVLSSNPQRLKQIWVILQNALANVVQPLIPAIVYLAQKLANLMTAFSNMNPAIQKMVLAGLGSIALFGLLVRYLGALSILKNTAKHFFMFSQVLVGPVIGALKLVLSPIALMGKAILGVGGVALRLPILMMKGIGASTAIFARILPVLSTVATASVGIIDAMATGMFLVISRTFMALGPVMTAIGGGLSMIWGGILAVFGAEFTAFKTAFLAAWAGWLALMRFILAPAGMALNVIWGAVLTAMELMTVTWRLVMLSIMSWWGKGMGLVMSAVGKGLAELWRTLMLALAFITEVAGKQLIVIWRAMLTAMQAILFGFGIASAAIWRGIVLVAEASAFALGGAAALMSRGMMAIVTSPMKLVGLFAGGMRALMFVFAGGLRSMIMVGARLIPLIFSGPWGWAIAIALGLAYKFRDKLANLWHSIVSDFSTMPAGLVRVFSGIGNFFGKIGAAIEKVFWQLPSSIRDAMLAVIRVVQAAAMAVYHLFSYLNPFAHNSPSLVESVTNGMAVIRAQYASVGNIGNIFAKAAHDLASYKSIAASLGAGPFAGQRKDVADAFKGALPVFDALVNDFNRLTVAQNLQQAAVDKQQAVVDKWKGALDAANDALDAQQTKLDGLKDHLGILQDAYDAAQNKMQDFASAPIQGMGAMSDAIFDNQMAQKKLQLQMLQWQDVNGTLDDTANKIAQLAGSIESTQSEISTLRSAGAGSDILSPITAQLDAMVAQHDQLQKSVQNSPITEMQNQLDALDRKGQILDLQNSLQFDPLTRQVDQLANGMKELPFDQIIAGINQQRAAMNALQPQMDQANKAVDDQTAAVNAAKAARDALSVSYDAESKKLDLLKQGYQDIADAISNVEDALRSMGSTASDVNSAANAKRLSPGAQNFIDAAGGNFPDVGGTAKIGREGNLTDQSAQIDAFTKSITADTANMFGGFDMFGPIKDMWKQTWTWIKTNVGPYVTPVVTAIKSAFAGMGNPFGGAGGGGSWLKDTFGGMGSAIAGYMQPVTNVFVGLYHGIMKIWELFAPDAKKIFSALVDGVLQIWNKLGPQLAAFIPLVMPLFKALSNFLKIVLAPALIFVIYWCKLIVSVLANTLGPVITYLVNTLANFLQVFRGALMIFIGLFTGNWKMMWDGVKLIFEALWNQIINVFQTVPAILWGIAKGLVEGIYGFFKWLLSMAPQPVQDMFSAIGGFFVAFWDGTKAVFDAVGSAFSALWDGMKAVWNAVGQPIFDFIVAYFKTVFTVFKWVWDNLVSPIWNLWWGTMRRVWETIGLILLIAIVGAVKLMAAIFGWVWTNVIKPAWDILMAGLKLGWNAVGKPVMDAIVFAAKAVGQFFSWLWRDYISPGWSAMTGGLSTGWTKGGKPVLDAVVTAATAVGNFFKNLWKDYIQPGWDGLWSGVSTTWTRVGKPIFNAIVGAVNAVIKAINALTGGLNSVGGALGISLKIEKIPELPKLAQGGLIPSQGVGSGFVTNQARAIVGEGGSYPEYVIPTDPKYRNRARDLYANLGKDIGMYAKGGILGDGLDKLKSAGSAVAGAAGTAVGVAGSLVRGGAAKLFEAALKLTDGLISQIPIKFLRDIAVKIRQMAVDWVAGKDAKLPPPPPPGSLPPPPPAGGHFGLAAGAILKGPVFTAGEAGHEVVTPLAPLWHRFDRLEAKLNSSVSSRGGGDTIININGNLEFPNITSGEDAETFVRNLEIAARK